jgi:dihydroorotate dehydrogenase
MTLLDSAYAGLARPVLFRLGGGDAETAHHQTLRALGAAGRSSVARSALYKLLLADHAPRRVFGITFPSAVGLAAGMDKDGLALRAWPALGFGFTEVGTVTAHSQPGNEKPRLFRLPDSKAIINRMGFNNSGAAALAARLEDVGPLPTPLGISLGKSQVTPVEDAVDDYLTSLRLLHSYADYIAINVSSPNTPGLRSLQDREPLVALLGSLTTEARSLAERVGSRPVPLLVKIAPDLTDHAVGELLEVCQDTGVSGVIATNTTLSREGVLPVERPLAEQAGGLSGAPLTARAREVVRFVAGHTDLPVIGVGGIMSADDGLSLLDAGASLLQIYTGFIYAGPGLVRTLNQAVAVRDRGAHRD